MQLLLVIISTLICFSASLLLLSPKVRNRFSSFPFAVYFMFEGTWQLVNHIISGIFPTNNIMDIIHSIFVLLLTAFIIFSILRKQK